MEKRCAVDGCEAKYHCHGHCSKHNTAYKKYGDPLGKAPPRPISICKVVGCGSRVDSHGYCGKHSAAFRRWGDPLGKASRKKRTCLVFGCGKKHDSLGYCGKHAQAFRRYGDPLEVRGAKPDVGTDFVKKAAIAQTDECIIFPYSKNQYGYGQATWEGKQRGAHRITLILAKGPPPFKGAFALHHPTKCTSKACVNPRHLRWGSRADNMADAHIEGVIARGVEVHGAKLTPDLVREIRSSPETQYVIADRLGVSHSHISSVRRRKSWAWVV